MRQLYDSDVEAGSKAGVFGSPTFFLGVTDPKKPSVQVVRVIRGAQPYQAFKDAHSTPCCSRLLHKKQASNSRPGHTSCQYPWLRATHSSPQNGLLAPSRPRSCHNVQMSGLRSSMTRRVSECDLCPSPAGSSKYGRDIKGAAAKRLQWRHKVNEMLRINEAQRNYYEHADGAAESEINSAATNFWRRWRGKALSVYDDAAIDQSLSEVHLRWLGGDLSRFKVLDLGVGYGNPLSMKLAREAREYVAIDLSAPLVERFQRQLTKAGTRNARALVADILSDEFAERDFDVVYARAVFHHFKYFDAFLENLRNRMVPGGVVVTLDDPLETWLPMKLLRLAYRPFQTDASWEYPVTAVDPAQHRAPNSSRDVQGTYGFSKWAIPLGFVRPDLVGAVPWSGTRKILSTLTT